MHFWRPSWNDNRYSISLYSIYGNNHLYQFWYFYHKVRTIDTPIVIARRQGLGRPLKNSVLQKINQHVFCYVVDKDKAFHAVSTLLKDGGQFCYNDVMAQSKQPESARCDVHLLSNGVGGGMVWSELKGVTERWGFSTPHLTQTAPVKVETEELRRKLGHVDFVCAGWRIFKLGKTESSGAATVSYLGNIEDYPDYFPWDFDLTFRTGEPVNVDDEMTTVLRGSNFKHCFTFHKFEGQVDIKRNQDPFLRLIELANDGKARPPIYTVK